MQVYATTGCSPSTPHRRYDYRRTLRHTGFELGKAVQGVRGGTEWSKMIQRLKESCFSLFFGWISISRRFWSRNTIPRVVTEQVYAPRRRAQDTYFRVANKHNENALHTSRALIPVQVSWTLNHQPNFYPEPCTLNPAPLTPHPSPLIPQPSTLSPEP